MATEHLERFKMTCLYDGGQGNLPTKWRLFERIATEGGSQWRVAAEGPGETAELIEQIINAYTTNGTAKEGPTWIV